MAIARFKDGGRRVQQIVRFCLMAGATNDRVLYLSASHFYVMHLRNCFADFENSVAFCDATQLKSNTVDNNDFIMC